MSVNNKDILLVWWHLTNFYSRTLIYHVLQCFEVLYMHVLKYVLSKNLDA